jgi:hypothetical protein
MSADSVMVDPEALAIALEDHDPETEWVLDLRTGEVIPVTNPLVTGDTATRDEVAGDPERYLGIEPIPAHESFILMESFAEELRSGDARDRLLKALRRKHPFREFKAELHASPAHREQWFQYHDARMRVIAERWLEENGVKARLGAGPRPERQG